MELLHMRKNKPESAVLSSVSNPSSYIKEIKLCLNKCAYI